MKQFASLDFKPLIHSQSPSTPSLSSFSLLIQDMVEKMTANFVNVRFKLLRDKGTQKTIYIAFVGIHQHTTTTTIVNVYRCMEWEDEARIVQVYMCARVSGFDQHTICSMICTIHRQQVSSSTCTTLSRN